MISKYFEGYGKRICEQPNSESEVRLKRSIILIPIVINLGPIIILYFQRNWLSSRETSIVLQKFFFFFFFFFLLYEWLQNKKSHLPIDFGSRHSLDRVIQKIKNLHIRSVTRLDISYKAADSYGISVIGTELDPEAHPSYN